MYRDLLQSLEQGGCGAVSDVARRSVAERGQTSRGDFVSMLGVPIASVANHYGYLCVLNRIGLPGFTEEDLAVARAIAAQVAVAYENARQHQALRSEVARRAEMESEVRRAESGSGTPRRRAHRRAGNRQSRARSVFLFGRARPACAVAIDPCARADAARLSRPARRRASR